MKTNKATSSINFIDTTIEFNMLLEKHPPNDEERINSKADNKPWNGASRWNSIKIK